MDATADAAALIRQVPYAQFLGMRVERFGDEHTFVLPFAEHLIGNTALPALHGGAIGAFLELSAVLQLLVDTAGERMPKTIDIGIDYLRSGRPVDTWARVVVAKHGRRVANVRAEAWQEERTRPIAAMHGHFLLAPRT